MKPSSERTEQSNESSRASGVLRTAALGALVLVLVAAPVAAVTGAASGGPSADAAAAGSSGTDGDVAVPHDETTTVAASGSSGSASASGAADSGVPPDEIETDPRELSYGESTTGRVDEDDPESEDRRGYHDPVTFEGEAGDTVTVEMIAGPGPGVERPPEMFRPEFGGPGGLGAESLPDPYLILVGPDGDVVARNDDTGRSLNARIQGVVLPEDGEYTIVATSYAEEATFPYRLSLEREGGDRTDLRSIEINSTVTGEIDKADPFSEERRGFYEPVTFEGSEGQTLRIEMGSRPGDTYLLLLGPDGSVIAENDDNDRSLNSTIESVRLPADGEYTVVATSFSPFERFTYSLTVEQAGVRDGGGADLREISFGMTASSELDEGDPTAPFLRGHYEPVSFESRPGQSVTIEMTSERGDTYLILYGPDGNVVARNDDVERGLNSRIEVTLEEPGRYTIIATSYDPEATFDYELSLTEGGGGGSGDLDADLRSIEYGDTAEGAIDRDDPRSRIYRGYYEPVTFDGEAGDQVGISMNSERGDTFLILLSPNGTVVTSNDDAGRSLNSRIETTLSADGEYTVIATSYDPEATFAYELSVERLDVAES